MKRGVLFGLSSASLLFAAACEMGSPASDLRIEELPAVQPSLPAVPDLPPPPHPVKYADQSYSLYGLRKRINSTIDTDVEMTGYIVQIFTPPECPAGRTCPLPAAPHLYLADTRGEADPMKRVLLSGYAENHEALNEAIEAARRGRPLRVDPESGMLPIPTDFAVGAKVKLTARFTRVSGTGFSQPDGVLEYRAHTIVEPSPDAAAPSR